MEKQKVPEVGVAIRRAFAPEIRSVDEKKRQITFQSSDESVDRYHDVIRCSGWDYQAYLRNPIVLWSHQNGELPIGKCVNLTIETSPPALVQTVEFATHDFAQTVFDLYRGKFLSAVSVGFMPLSPPVPLSDLEGNFTGYEFSNQELLELSCVNVPANKNALARAVESGSFSAADLEKAFSVSTGEELVAEKPAAKHRSLSEIQLDMAALSEELLLLSQAAGARQVPEKIKDGLSEASALEEILGKMVAAE